MTKTLFDTSLPSLVKTLTQHQQAGTAFVEEGTVLRDASGRLTFFSARPAASEEERHALGKALNDALGPYARAERPIVFADESGARSILESEQRVPIEVDGVFCSLLDRRIVGVGWLDSPRSMLAHPPRIVFATLKGGVGRSTALVVAAADLARRNRNVLVVDLDLEAPGLGNMLLSGDRVPELGAIDFLVEDGLGGVAPELLPSFVGTSDLTKPGGGRVDVVPALGSRSSEYPENVLAKL